MIDENIALALLQSSVTGAGLILAVYALLIPIAGQIFERRAKELKENIELYKKESGNIDGKITDKKIQKIRDSLDNIGSKTTPPEYMRIGIMISFIGYIISIFMSLWWLLDWNKPIMDGGLPSIFGVTTFVFLIVGVISIKDIYSVFTKEYEKLKSDIEEEKVKINQ